jgi:peptide/nickel transport system permease protein
MAPTLLAISFIAFMIIQLPPGDFADVYRSNPQFSDETIREIVHQFRLDKPVMVQYFHWLLRAVQLDFGVSTTYTGVKVFTLIAMRMKATFLLSLMALVFTWIISVPLGVYSAIKQYSIGDKTLSVLAFVGMSLPTFFIAFLLLYLATLVDWLPAGGLVSSGYNQLTPMSKFLDYLWHMTIPVTVMVLSSVAGMMRLMRGNMLEIKSAQYITTARAKGLSENKVIFKHMLRNAINPMITLFGYQLSGLLSGVALTEAVLAYPGMGRLMLEAVIARDLFLVMASLVMSSFLLLLGNLLADIFLSMSDPRISLS